jgi:hypothetical protein
VSAFAAPKKYTYALAVNTEIGRRDDQGGSSELPQKGQLTILTLVRRFTRDVERANENLAQRSASAVEFGGVE